MKLPEKCLSVRLPQVGTIFLQQPDSFTFEFLPALTEHLPAQEMTSAAVDISCHDYFLFFLFKNYAVLAGVPTSDLSTIECEAQIEDTWQSGFKPVREHLNTL